MYDVYTINNYLYGYPLLVGKPVHLEYLRTRRSTKWRKSWRCNRYTEESAYNDAIKLMQQEKWASIRFVEVKN